MMPPQVRAAPSGLSERQLVVLLARTTQLLAFSDRFLITLVAQPLKTDLALSDAQLGVLQGSAFALLNAAAMPWGRPSPMPGAAGSC